MLADTSVRPGRRCRSCMTSARAVPVMACLLVVLSCPVVVPVSINANEGGRHRHLGCGTLGAGTRPRRRGVPGSWSWWTPDVVGDSELQAGRPPPHDIARGTPRAPDRDDERPDPHRLRA